MHANEPEMAKKWGKEESINEMPNFDRGTSGLPKGFTDVYTKIVKKLSKGKGYATLSKSDKKKVWTTLGKIYNESINESNIIKKIDKLAKANKYGTVDGTRMNGKTAREIMAVFMHPKMNSYKRQMVGMKSHELVDLTISLLKSLKIKVESINEAKGYKVTNSELSHMVTYLSDWSKEFDGNMSMGKNLHGKPTQPYYHNRLKKNVSGGKEDALKALIKDWKKYDVSPAMTTKIFKTYHKLSTSKQKFGNPDFWENFLEKQGISVVYESINESKIKYYKTISKKEWSKTPKSYKSVIDGVKFKLFLDRQKGTILAPVKVESVNESGILYKAGVKKYGKEGMAKILSAAGKKKSHAEIGAIKDKYEKESLELDEGGMGILDKDQTDVLHAIVMKNKNKNSKSILSITMKDRMFKGVDKKELLGYIEGAKEFVRYMGRTGNESINEKMKMGPEQYHRYLQYVFDTQFKTPEEKKMKKSIIKKINKAQKKKGLPLFKEERDYKAEYKKFQSSTKSKKYRAELNQYNRKKGTYGNGDGKDASHKGGKIAGFEKESTNRGRREKSRLKKENIRESINEAVEPQGNMAKIQKIVKNSQATKLGGVMIDMQSANILMKLWDAVSDKDKEKMNKLNAKVLTTIIKKLWSRINLKLPV